MRFEYDPEADAVYVQLQNAEVARSKRVDAGVVLDFDCDDGLIGVEVFSVSKRTAMAKPDTTPTASASEKALG